MSSPRPDISALRSRTAVIRLLVVAVVLLTADLVSKRVAFERVAGAPIELRNGAPREAVPPHDAIIVVPKVLALRLTLNRGAVFGLGQGARWVFVGFSVIAVGVIFTVFRRSRPSDLILHLALAAVLAGALGNLYDRLRFGVVRDMLLLFPGVELPFGLHWPGGESGLYPWIFNVADVCLVVGLIVLMILLYRHDRRAAAAARSTDESGDSKSESTA